MQNRRPGAALVLALLVLLVLECVVVGTLHLTRLERRLADNGATALRLRLAAESAARTAAGAWPPQLDSIALGAIVPAATSISAHGLAASARYQRVDSSLVLVFGEALELPPRFGVAHAALLIEPPLLTEAMLPAATLSSGADVRVRPSGVITAQPAPACADSTSAAALQLPDLTLLQLDAGGSIAGNVDVAVPAAEWRTRIGAIAAIVPPTVSIDSAGRNVYAGSSTAVIAVDGDIVIPASALVRGVILVTGALTIEAGAQVEGIVVVLGQADVHGTVRLSRCSAAAAIRQTALHRPRPHAARASIPGF